MARDIKDVYLEGQLLVAMPGMPDPRFARTVIFMCAHSADGAMGLVVNKPAEGVSFAELLRQLGIETKTPQTGRKVMTGGPVEQQRGFVLHSGDYRTDATMVVRGGYGLTSTLDVLRAIADGQGPRRSLLALGYSGWAPGQLDGEIQANGWLTAPADEDLVLGEGSERKWERAVAKIGVDVSMLSGEAGHA
ncbi:MAG: YqgE/AlgH family protein [Alphaproteobacteria bacterium]|nr:YqgE/AlgH family protein [Alphaproteobacteria bacterium]